MLYEMLRNPVVNNILNNIPKIVPDEIFETLFSKDTVNVERIISQGQCSAENDWYDQVQDEWVILLEGHAKLQFQNDLTVVDLKSGDYLLIPAHTKHRVHWTDPDIKTIWLAIHIYPSENAHE